MRTNIWSKPGDESTPSDVVRLSDIGGHDVSFSGDGKKVLWLSGPTLHVVDVAEVFRSCRYASAASKDSGCCVQDLVATTPLVASYETALSKQDEASVGLALAFVNATLASMDDSQPALILNATVIIENHVFTAIGPGSEIPLPSSCHIISLNGGAILPGFVDIHSHWGGFLSPHPSVSWEMSTFLGYGITTVHNPSSHNVAGMGERNRVEKGYMYGPRVFHTGDVLYGSTQPSVYTEINSMSDARDALLRIKIEGGDSSFSAKNYQLPARSARQRLLLAAKELDMLVVPEGGWSFDWDLKYFIDGFTSLEHPVPIPNLYDDVLSLIEASGSSYTPLAVMNYGGIFGQHWIHQTQSVPTDTKLRKYLKHDILESLYEVKQAPKSSYQFFNTTRSTAKLAERGVRTNVGSHGEQPIGYLYHSEMQMMALGGQSPLQVLRHATIGGATSLGLNGSLGSVEVGKLADLVIYPSGVDSIDKVWGNSMHMRYVVRGGTVLSVENGLEEVWPRVGRRQEMGRINAEDE